MQLASFQDLNFHLGVDWRTWALPLEIHLEPCRPWPTFRLTVGPFYFVAEWWRGAAPVES